MLVPNDSTGNAIGLVVRACRLLVGAAIGFLNGVIHVRLKVPSFMTTLGTWFIGVGVANALLGGMAVRINDPMIRGPRHGRASSACPGASGWRCLPRHRLVIQNHTRLGRYIYALGGGEDTARLPAFPSAGPDHDLHPRRRLLCVGGVLSAAQLGLGNAQIGRAGCSPPSPPWSSAARRSPAARAACCRRWSAC